MTDAATNAAPSAASRVQRSMNFLFPMLMIAMTIAALFRDPRPMWYEWIWLGAYWVQGIIRAPHARRNGANVITAGNRDRSEKFALGAMFICMGLLPVIEVGTNAFAFADYVLPPWMAVLGAALQLPFLWLFWRSHADLGRNWSPTLETREGHELVTSGIYARIRHPMYAAIWCSAIAQPLLVQNWIAGLPIIAAFAFMWFVRMPREEAMMRDRFGSAYDDYVHRTGKVFPRFSETREPSSRPEAMPSKEWLKTQEREDQ